MTHSFSSSMESSWDILWSPMKNDGISSRSFVLYLLSLAYSRAHFIMLLLMAPAALILVAYNDADGQTDRQSKRDTGRQLFGHRLLQEPIANRVTTYWLTLAIEPEWGMPFLAKAAAKLNSSRNNIPSQPSYRQMVFAFQIDILRGRKVKG